MSKKLSYSGLNKLLFSPKIYYRHYILGEKQDSIDSWAIEGSIVDAYLTDQKITDKFSVVPGNIPSESTKKLIYKIYKERNLENPSVDLLTYQEEILEGLREINLHQALKTDAQRLDKILTEDAKNYFKFLCESEGKIVTDVETLINGKFRADLVKDDSMSSARLCLAGSSFNKEVLTQQMFEHDLTNEYGFILRGIPDRIVIDHRNSTITIFDIKTTGKTLADFYPDTYEYLKYDLQSAIYSFLIKKNLVKDELKSYSVRFEFFVIDKYDQFCFFPVSHASMEHNMNKLKEALNKAKYHLSTEDFSRPYEFKDGIYNI